jgi:hypothetical protein
MTDIHLLNEASKPIHAQPDVQRVCPDIHPLDQQPHDPRVLGRKELIPQRIEPLERRLRIHSGDAGIVRPCGLPRPYDDLRLP